MARVLGIGIATLDIVNLVDHYPVEDEELRAYGQQVRRGGNVTNSLVVLSQLGHRCSWAGVLAGDGNSQAIVEDLNGYGIDLEPCRRMDGGATPVSYIALSRSNGSRTIVHYRDLPEFGFDDFARLQTDAYDWIHLEGRNVEDCRRILEALQSCGFPQQCISLEIEKPRMGIETLLPYPGVVFVSRAYALAQGFQNPEQALQWLRHQAPDAALVCPWGEQGAWCQLDDRSFHVPASEPAQVVDTLGAGDTFNAGVIDARLRGLDWSAALAAANELAARKCAQFGFAGLAG